MDMTEFGVSEPDNVTAMEYARVHRSLTEFAQKDLSKVENNLAALDAEAGLIGNDLSKVVSATGKDQEIVRGLQTPVLRRELGEELTLQVSILKTILGDKFVTVSRSNNSGYLFYNVSLPVEKDFSKYPSKTNFGITPVLARDNTAGNGETRYPLKNPGEVQEYLRIAQMAVQDVMEVIDKPQNMDNDIFSKALD